MKKTIILPLMILLVMSFVGAAENAVPIDATNLISLWVYNETSGNIIDLKGYANFTKTAGTNDVLYRADAVLGFGYNWTATSDGAYFTGNKDYREKTSTNDYSIFAIVKLKTVVASQCLFDNAAEGAELGIHWCFAPTLAWEVYAGGSQSGRLYNADGCTSLENNTWLSVGVIVNSSGIEGWHNSTMEGSHAFSTTSTAAASGWLHRAYSNAARQPYGMVAEMAFCQPACSPTQFSNWTDTFFAGEVDTTPPVISTYNCTSCNGGDTEAPYQTTDTTPTFKITTNEPALCAIASVDKNYTDMTNEYSYRNCTTTGGTTAHICTLHPDEMLLNETDFVYFGCRDTNGNENLTSSSGPQEMSMNTSDVETEGESAIMAGINSSVIWQSTPTIYSNQQVYLRDLNNNQTTGTFDRLVSYENQRWAFNYVTTGESLISGLFNITPAFYAAEYQEMTYQAINDSVRILINETY